MCYEYLFSTFCTNPTLHPMYNTYTSCGMQLTKKLANHGIRRFLPLAPPMGWRRPTQAYWRHPTSWANVPMLSLGIYKSASKCQGIWYDRHIVKVFDLSVTMFYNAPLSNVSSIAPSSILLSQCPSIILPLSHELFDYCVVLPWSLPSSSIM